MTAVLKREIKKYYTSLVTYLYYALFFLACGILFSVYCLANYNSQFGYYVLSKAFYVCVFLIPLFTMQMFAGERQRKTDRLLFTSPVSYYSIVAAKYLSAVIVLVLPVLLSIIYPVIIMHHSDVDMKFLICSYLAVCLGVLVLTAIGMFISEVTPNPVMAALLLYAFYVILILMRIVEAVSGQGGLYYFLHNISIYNIYSDIVSGIVRSGNIVFALVLIILFFNLTWLGIIFNRIVPVRRLIGIVIMTLSSVVICAVFYANSVTMDFTPEKLLTLSSKTISILNDVDKDTRIYYIGRISNANATYQEFLKLYEKQNDYISVEYVDINDNSSIKTKYLNGITMINDASILVVCEDNYIYLDSDEYISTIKESDYEYRSILEIENQLSEAIYYTNNAEKKYIYTLSDNKESGFSERMINKLHQKGYELETISLKENLSTLESTIPDKCDVLIINSPEEDYSDDEINALSSYIDDGGKIIVFIDPLNEDLTNLYSFLGEYGLSVESGIIVEKETELYSYDTPYYLAPKIQKHEITDVLLESNLPVYTMTSKGIKVDENTSDKEREDLLLTSRIAFSKKSDYDNITEKGDEDVGGPFSVASIVKKDEGELILVTTNILLNDDVDKDSLGANSKLFISMLNYMSGIGTDVNIAGKDVKYNVALYQTGFVKLMKAFGIVIIPLLILLFGIAVVIIRKNNVMIKLKENERKEQS